MLEYRELMGLRFLQTASIARSYETCRIQRARSSSLIKLLLCTAMALVFAAPGTSKTSVLPKQPVRVMTYNIHHGEGTDGKIDLNRIAEVIMTSKADIVALQEVDRGVERTAHRDLVVELAELTKMNFAFGKNIDYQGGDYGNAVLSRFRVLKYENRHYKMIRDGEQRGLLQVVLQVAGKQLVFLNTHLDYRRDDAERLSNVDEIEQVIRQYKGLPLILCGDFNDTPDSPMHRKMEEFLVDCWIRAGKGDGLSFSSTQPQKRIDYVFVNKRKGVEPVSALVAASNASDHLPVVVEFRFP